jgi:hypothetical protein
MRFPRVTTQRWMTAVAVVALLMAIGGEVVRESRLASRYRRLADAYRFAEDLNSGKRTALGVGGRWIRADHGSPEWAAYYGEMRRKYERAARFPFLPVAADPPEPKGLPGATIAPE